MLNVRERLRAQYPAWANRVFQELDKYLRDNPFDGKLISRYKRKLTAKITVAGFSVKFTLVYMHDESKIEIGFMECEVL